MISKDQLTRLKELAKNVNLRPWRHTFIKTLSPDYDRAEILTLYTYQAVAYDPGVCPHPLGSFSPNGPYYCYANYLQTISPDFILEMIADTERLQKLAEDNSVVISALSKEIRVLKTQTELLADRLAGTIKCGKTLSADDWIKLSRQNAESAEANKWG